MRSRLSVGDVIFNVPAWLPYKSACRRLLLFNCVINQLLNRLLHDMTKHRDRITHLNNPECSFHNIFSSGTSEAKSENYETEDTTTEANKSDSAATKIEDEVCQEKTSSTTATTTETSDTASLTETSESTQS